MTMPIETWADNAYTVVLTGGTDAPAAGTPETWTVASSSPFPAAAGPTAISPGVIFHVGDTAQPSELIAVGTVSGTTWTVTRGAEGTTPVTHAAAFTVYQVVTSGGLNSLQPATPAPQISQRMLSV